MEQTIQPNVQTSWWWLATRCNVLLGYLFRGWSTQQHMELDSNDTLINKLLPVCLPPAAAVPFWGARGVQLLFFVLGELSLETSFLCRHVVIFHRQTYAVASIHPRTGSHSVKPTNIERGAMFWESNTHRTPLLNCGLEIKISNIKPQIISNPTKIAKMELRSVYTRTPLSEHVLESAGQVLNSCSHFVWFFFCLLFKRNLFIE